MSAISTTHYVLPPTRPWDPLRNNPNADNEWVEGKVVSGHPNICPLLDFFEDNHYYYLVLPSTTPEPKVDEPQPPSDLLWTLPLNQPVEDLSSLGKYSLILQVEYLIIPFFPF